MLSTLSLSSLYLTTSCLFLLVQAQSSPSAPPSACNDVCSPVLSSIRQSCRQSPSFPSTEDSKSEKWNSLANSLADCLAPIFKTAASDTCSLCLLTNDPRSQATQFFVAVKQDVFSQDKSKVASTILTNVFKSKGISTSNVTTTAIAIPSATATPTSAVASVSPSSPTAKSSPQPSHNSAPVSITFVTSRTAYMSMIIFLGSFVFFL